jgi:hypothetical protein
MAAIPPILGGDEKHIHGGRQSSGRVHGPFSEKRKTPAGRPNTKKGVRKIRSLLLTDMLGIWKGK